MIKTAKTTLLMKKVTEKLQRNYKKTVEISDIHICGEHKVVTFFEIFYKKRADSIKICSDMLIYYRT